MTTIDMRLQEASAILETFCDQRVLIQADLWYWEQEYQTALSDARRRDQDELQYWLSQEHYYQLVLQQWMFQQSEAARVALEQHKRWGYRILLLVGCLCSCGLFLSGEMKEIRKLQSQRDYPTLGEQQRLWSRMIQEAQKNIHSLHALQEPRQTLRLRACNQEVHSLRRRLDVLETQIQLQQTRVQVLQQQRSLYAI